jgi:hypothetical protein
VSLLKYRVRFSQFLAFLRLLSGVSAIVEDGLNFDGRSCLVKFQICQYEKIVPHIIMELVTKALFSVLIAFDVTKLLFPRWQTTRAHNFSTRRGAVSYCHSHLEISSLVLFAPQCLVWSFPCSFEHARIRIETSIAQLSIGCSLKSSV